MEIEFFVQVDKGEFALERNGAIAVGLGAVLFPLLCALVLGTRGILFWGTLVLGIAFWAGKKGHRYWAWRQQRKRADSLRLLDDALLYLRRGQPAIQIPLKAIARIEYDDGISLYLKKPLSQPLTLLDRSFPIRRQRKGADFRFPLFAPSVKARLQDVVHPDQTHKTSRL